MNKIMFLLTALLLTVGLYAQKQWTLEECIQYAIDHNITVKQMALQRENAATNLQTSQMSRLPNLNANVGQNWSFGRKQIESGLYDSDIQSQSTTNLSVSGSIPLFTGFRIPNEIARDKLSLQAATENLERAKEDLAINIASLFLQALFNKELLKVSEEQLALSHTQRAKTEAMVLAEKAAKAQLYEIEAQVAKDEVSLVQAKNNLALALLDLAQSLELDDETGFDISAPETNDVISEYASRIEPPSLIFNHAVQVRPAIKAQEYNLASAEKSVKIAQSGYLPSLNLNMSYSNNYFHSYGMNNTPFADQWRNNAGEAIGLSLNIPIFNRFSVRNQVRNAKINLNTQQLELDRTKKTMYKEIQTAYLNATAAQEKYAASEKSVKAATESYSYVQERYEANKASVFELNEAKTKLAQSQAEQIQAKYDFIFRAKILEFYGQ
ncbi:MAG: TolC family protein [Candidatus Symbiothrix sp.]|jgi:outer membrane protein|nr:TolC family protein [Candidatus Symbiothrix sp.]